uniref:Tryptophyllin-13 n=1 Tax=Pithecopus rohdei TaxID=8394 RepID=TY13_PITRO|nr:RecName: Full=Tryptophyllin-13 [Pithecopus rohdei]
QEKPYWPPPIYPM